MACPKVKNWRYLKKLYPLLQRLEKSRRQSILLGLFSEVQRRLLECWLLRRPCGMAPRPTRPSSTEAGVKRKMGLSTARSPGARSQSRGVISRTRNGRTHFFSVVVVQRLELRTKELSCPSLAAKYQSLLLDIKHQISEDLGRQRLRKNVDEALAPRLLAKVYGVLAHHGLDADRDLGLYFRAVTPLVGTTLCGPVFHPRNFRLGLQGWQYMQLARGTKWVHTLSPEELQDTWDRSRQAFLEVWAAAGRPAAASARRLELLERRQSFQRSQLRRADQQKRREETKALRSCKAASRQQRLEARIQQLLGSWSRSLQAQLW